MLHEGRQRHVERRRQRGHGLLAAAERADDRAAGRVRQRMEHVADAGIKVSHAAKYRTGPRESPGIKCKNAGRDYINNRNHFILFAVRQFDLSPGVPVSDGIRSEIASGYPALLLAVNDSGGNVKHCNISFRLVLCGCGLLIYLAGFSVSCPD
ncbi:hypothetical protein [Burkholderia sp. F1]|uniref:hypothetical protein n=1 Tax=Burkholderia sp. F1 TaxID=3366817 RepID=UPI003D717956